LLGEPAARRIGAVYSRSNCSISASRMSGRPWVPWAGARVGMPASASANAVTSASARSAGVRRRSLLTLALIAVLFS
jgi:hypothetical protein